MLRLPKLTINMLVVDTTTMLTAEAEAINPEKQIKRRGRKPLPPEERERRKVLNRNKQNARQRAMAILATRHSAEFTNLVQVELDKIS